MIWEEHRKSNTRSTLEMLSLSISMFDESPHMPTVGQQAAQGDAGEGSNPTIHKPLGITHCVSM